MRGSRAEGWRAGGGGGVVAGGGPAQAELAGRVAVVPDRGGVGQDERAVVRLLAGQQELAVLEPEVVEVADEDALELRLVLVAWLSVRLAGLGQDAGRGQRAERGLGDRL